MSHNTHGGPRRGAGRKPISASGRMKPTAITLPPELLAAARELGAGKASEGVRIALLHWLADNTPPAQELQIWQHTPTGEYYLILWQGVLGAAAGPLPLDQAQAIQAERAPAPEQWPDLADWVDDEWDAGRMARRVDLEAQP